MGPIVVSGTVAEPTASVEVDGVPASVRDGTFTAQIPLHEGNNTIAVVARNTLGEVDTASIQVTLDSQPPRVGIDSPPDGFVTDLSRITVTGMINDIVVGTVNGDQARVTVNGIDAEVSNRSFLAADVLLSPGANSITAIGQDASGNRASTTITVIFQEMADGPRISLVSGNNQSGPIASQLPEPLVVQLTDGNGIPALYETVIFEVVENNGTLSASPEDVRSVAVKTGDDGRAQVNWVLGTRAGAGNNMVEAVTVGFGGMAIFTATASPNPPDKINVDAGNNQTGIAGEALAHSFVAVVTDAGHNRLAHIPITFTVTQGGGNFDGADTFTVDTDSDGRALAVLTLGSEEGFDSNVVEATYPNNPGLPASFMASGWVPADPADTRISGVVLDNSNNPIVGIIMRVEGTSLTAQTNDQGRFSIQPAPVGQAVLVADGDTVPGSETWPTLKFEMVTVAGQDNTIGMPIFLLPLDLENALLLDETTGGTITLPEVPGFSLTIAPGSATFPDGSKSGLVSVTVVHADKIPMVPNFGQQPRFIITIQPAGVLFDPPAPITLPNVDAMAPGAVTEMYSFDHDLGQFVSIGTGTVSEDGTVIASDPGVGIIKGGWHCGGDPTITSGAANAKVKLETVCTSPCRLFSDVEQPMIIVKGQSVKLQARGGPTPGDFTWSVSFPARGTKGVLKRTLPRGETEKGPSATFKAEKVGIATIIVRYKCKSGALSPRVRIKVLVIEITMRAFEISDTNNFKDNPTDTKLFIGESGPGISNLRILVKTNFPDDISVVNELRRYLRRLRWSVSPGGSSTGRRISGKFVKAIGGERHDFGDHIAEFGTDTVIPLADFLSQGTRDVQINVGLGTDSATSGVLFDQVTNIMDVRVIRVELDVDKEGRQVQEFNGTPVVMVNDDFDEVKRDAAGELVPDNQDVSPLTADGSAYASGDLVFLDVKAPEDDALRAGSRITINQTGGNGRVRLLVLSGRRLDVIGRTESVFDEIALGANLLDDLFTPGGRFYTWFPAVEGITPGEVTLELRFEKGGTTVRDTLTLNVLGLKIEWLKRDGTVISDPNNHPSGTVGLRYFPGATDQEVLQNQVSYNRRVRVRVTVDGPIDRVPVFVKHFDPDDPSSNVSILDFGGPAGFDNRNKFSGFIARSTALLPDTTPNRVQQGRTRNKVFEVDFILSTQPGDNHRVAVALFDSDKMSAIRGHDEVPPSNESLPDFDGKLSDLLTIWRTLHIEVDSMKAESTVSLASRSPDITFERIVSVTPGPARGTASCTTIISPLNCTTLVILGQLPFRGGPTDGLDSYEGGRVGIAGAFFPILSNTAFNIGAAAALIPAANLIWDTIVIRGVPTLAQTTLLKAGIVEIRDDDAIADQLPITTAINSWIEDQYKRAYIHIEEVDRSLNTVNLVAFDHQMNDEERENEARFDIGWTAGRELDSTKEYWAHTIVMVYQLVRSPTITFLPPGIFFEKGEGDTDMYENTLVGGVSTNVPCKVARGGVPAGFTQCRPNGDSGLTYGSTTDLDINAAAGQDHHESAIFVETIRDDTPIVDSNEDTYNTYVGDLGRSNFDVTTLQSIVAGGDTSAATATRLTAALARQTNLMSNPITLTQRVAGTGTWFEATVAHEIGHGPVGDGRTTHHGEPGLMSVGAAARDAGFSPETLNRFRTEPRW